MQVEASKITAEDVRLMVESIHQPLQDFKEIYKKVFRKHGLPEDYEMSDLEAADLQQIVTDSVLDLILLAKQQGVWL